MVRGMLGTEGEGVCFLTQMKTKGNAGAVYGTGKR